MAAVHITGSKATTVPIEPGYRFEKEKPAALLSDHCPALSGLRNGMDHTHPATHLKADRELFHNTLNIILHTPQRGAKAI
jgi:hypothetical protein